MNMLCLFILLVVAPLCRAEDRLEDRLFLFRSPKLVEDVRHEGCKLPENYDGVIVFSTTEAAKQKVGEKYSVLTAEGTFIRSTLLGIGTGPQCQPLGAVGDFAFGVIKMDKTIDFTDKDEDGDEALIVVKGSPLAASLGGHAVLSKIAPKEVLAQITRMRPPAYVTGATDFVGLSFANSSNKYLIAHANYIDPKNVESTGEHPSKDFSSYFNVTKQPKLIFQSNDSLRIFGVLTPSTQDFLLGIQDNGQYSGSYEIRKYQHGSLKNQLIKTLYKWGD